MAIPSHGLSGSMRSSSARLPGASRTLLLWAMTCCSTDLLWVHAESSPQSVHRSNFLGLPSPVEEPISRLKILKRTTYSRAGVDLLRARLMPPQNQVLHPKCIRPLLTATRQRVLYCHSGKDLAAAPECIVHDISHLCFVSDDVGLGLAPNLFRLELPPSGRITIVEWQCRIQDAFRNIWQQTWHIGLEPKWVSLHELRDSRKPTA